MASIISGVDAKKNLRWNNRVLVTYERLKLQGVKPAAHVTFTPTNSQWSSNCVSVRAHAHVIQQQIATIRILLSRHSVPGQSVTIIQ